VVWSGSCSVTAYGLHYAQPDRTPSYPQFTSIHQPSHAVDRKAGAGQSAFQKGSAGMRLSDENKGLKGRIPDDLFDELDDFIQRRRNPLAHNFLVERISAEAGGRFASGTILFLVESTIAASKLNDRMQAVADEIRSTWPEQPKPPDEVLKFMETLGRVTMLKQFPQDFVERASGADAPDG